MTNVVVTVKWWKKFQTKKFDYNTFFRFKTDEQVRFCAEIGLYGLEASQGVLRGPRPRTEQFVPVLIVEEAVPELEAQLGRDRRSL
jgi:hypothetical protein